MSQPATPTPADRLLNLIVALLTPMFLWSAEGDVALARIAAMETVKSYGLTGSDRVFRAAKIIAFDLAALSSLSLAMADDLAVPLVVRLRGNANSMDRAAERNRTALEQDGTAATTAAKTAHLTEDRAAASVAEAQKLVQDAKARTQPAHQPPVRTAHQPPVRTAQQPPVRAPMSDRQRQTAWAGAMADVAAEFSAGLNTLPPAARAAEIIRIDALTSAASALATGTVPIPPVNRSPAER